MIGAKDRYWQRVPKVNVLPGQRRAPSKDIILRGLLALIVVVGIYLVWSQWNTRADIKESIDLKTTDIRSMQSRLTGQRQGIESLQVQINQLKQQQEGPASAIELVTAGGIDWYASMSSLFSAQASGLIFESVTAEQGGRVLLAGLATEPGSKASLPTQFSRISSILDFQGIVWAEGSGPTTFSATFQVRQ